MVKQNKIFKNFGGATMCLKLVCLTEEKKVFTDLSLLSDLCGPSDDDICQPNSMCEPLD